MDRTNDFVQLCHLFQQQTTITSKKDTNDARANPMEAQAFSAAASDISKEVHLVSSRLSQLTLLVKQNNMFNDPSADINELTNCIKMDITNINTQLDNLQLYANNHRSGGGAQTHTDVIVNQMKSNLMETTKGFKDILQVRQDNLQLVNNRRSRYGNFGKAQRRSFQANAGLPRPDGIQAEGGGSENAPLIAPAMQATLPEQDYVGQRAEAMDHIQSHIVELGQVFSRLSNMISEQGEMVARIDDQVDDAVSNMNAGQQELVRYFENLSSNKLLALKVSGILLVFLVFFMFFMA